MILVKTVITVGIICIAFFVEESIMHRLTGTSLLDQMRDWIYSLFKKIFKIHSPSKEWWLSNCYDKEVKRDD